MSELTFNDSRSNSLPLGSTISSPSCSVKHTRERTPNPAGPHSFTPANPNREHTTFGRATATRSFLWLAEYELYGYHSSYNGKKSDCFYFRPLSASRTRAELSLSSGFFGYSNEPYYPISKLPIFNLPENCVDQILSYFSSPDLAILALVDKDCRQLARARQFRSVWINFSSASMGLLKKLVDEGCGRAQNLEKRHMWTLGACIRRISIAPGPGRGGPLYTQTSWVDHERKKYEAVEYHQSHMNALGLALRVGLPSLDFLDWSDMIPITPLLTNAIMSSPITRLELRGVNLTDDFDLCRSKRNRQIGESKWKLRRLVLSLGSRNSNGTVVFTRSILKLAAPTLEELVWEGYSSNRGFESYSLGPEPIPFKNLKKLQMTNVLVDDNTVLSGLILGKDEGQKLMHLYLEGRDKKLGPFLAGRGHISTLTHLNWPDFALHQDIDACISFFTANPQLETIQFDDCPPKLIDNPLGPLIASNFNNLTSLALSWDATEIKPASLHLIGTITTLKHLWLSAGLRLAEEFEWLVNHRTLRKKLRPLKQLEWLALTRDLYPNGNDHVRFSNQPKSQEWEDDHRRLMVGHAIHCARSHPKLEWVYFGQVPMSIKRTGSGAGDVDAVPLKGREDCEMLLMEMWGASCADWAYFP